MVGRDKRLTDYIERTLAAEDSVALMCELEIALADWGFDYMACGTFGGDDATAAAAAEGNAPPWVVTYPVAWQKHYFEQNYVTIDPVVTRAAQAYVPYRWDQFAELTPTQNRMFNEAREVGLLHGLTVPIHSPGGEVFVAAIASPNLDVDHRRSMSIANLLVSQTHMMLMDIKHHGAPAAPVRLTNRERECLIWSAKGKSSWDIGVILNISDNTVNFHLKNAMAKLGASTRVMAIVKAIRIGLIVP